MKKKILIIYSLFLLLNTINILGGNVISEVLKKGKDVLQPKNEKKELIVFGVFGRIEKLLADLKADKKIVEEETKKFNQDTSKQILETTKAIKDVNTQLRQKPTDSFLNTKIAILNEIYQSLKDIQTSRKQKSSLLNSHIKLLQDYLKDPNLTEYLKEYREEKRFYTFKNLQNLHQTILDQEKRIQSLDQQLKNANIELENRDQAATAASESYNKTKKELEDFVKEREKTTTPDYMFAFTSQQKLEILTLQENLHKIKNELDQYKLKETEYKVGLIESKLYIEKLKLKIIKKAAKRVKSTIRIVESDIVADKTKLEKKKRDSFVIKEKYRPSAEALSKESEIKLNQLNSLSAKYKVPINIELNQWAVEPKTSEEYVNTLHIGSKNENVELLNRKKELIEANMSKEDEELFNSKIQLEVKGTFYKIIAKKFESEDEINKDIKKHIASQAEINARIAKFKEKKNVAQDKLNIKNKAIENIKSLREKIKKEKNVIFRTVRNYTNCLNYLQNAQELINQQIKLLQTTIAVYNKIIEINNNSDKQVEFITSELETLSMWYRPAYAIKWEEIKNIFPEIGRFLADLKIYIVQFSFLNQYEKIKLAFPRAVDFVAFLIKILILLLLLLLFKIYAPVIHKKLINFSQKHKGTRFLTLLAAFVIEFLLKYFVLISIWIILFAVVKLEVMPDQYIYILFYLASIPYILYVANRLLNYFTIFNEKHGHVFIVRSFQKRFIIVLSVILYSTIIIQLVRKAFILGIYYKSELPSILLALNFIILQIALIAFIAKEQVLNIIPTKNNTWKWIHAQVSKFYYLILGIVILIIVLSNPYIGFSKLVWYVVSRIIVTILLIKALFFLHSLFKKLSLRLFFTTGEDVVKARFNYGKTVYGLFVILAFILLIGIGLIIGAYIWGWNISPASIYDNWLNKAILWGDDREPISIISLVKLLVFILSGFVLATSINKFVLRKIFDLLLVDAGVQNAIKSILKYIIITTFLIIGFQHIHLGNLVKWLLGALVFSIGWILKDPLADFAYYFLILIQRPLKIGDLIKTEKELGVVRKITPRSVIIRKRNSETALIPNSQVLSKAIINWNYKSGFIAFNDMLLTIAYNQDPSKAREILLQVLDNHPNILKSPKPIVRLNKFGEYGFVFLIRGFISSHYTLDMWDIAGDIRLSIVKALRDNNIEIAVPVRIIKTTTIAQSEAKEKD